MKFKFTFTIIPIIIIIIPHILSLPTYSSKALNSTVCSSGKLQSPIALSTSTSLYSNSTIDYLGDNYNVINDKNTLLNGMFFQVSAKANHNYGTILLERGGFITKYALKQINTHLPGEHSIDGVIGDVEVNLVHEKVLDYSPMTNEFRKMVDANKKLVINLIFKRGGNSNDFLSQLFKGWNNNQFSFKDKSLPLNLDLNKLNLINGRKYYFYEGSMNYKPCDENSNIIVISEFFDVSPDLISFIQSRQVDYLKIARTNKEISKSFMRPVLRNFITKLESKAGYLKIVVGLFGIIGIGLGLMV